MTKRRANQRPPAVPHDKKALLASFQKGDLKRIFIGVMMNPAHMAGYSALLPPYGPADWNWKKPDEYHITLALPGMLNDSGVDYLCSSLAKLAHPAFDGALTGLGCFDDRPQKDDFRDVLYARPGKATAARIHGLRHNIEQAITGAGLRADAPENRHKFVPHVTLAKALSTDRRALHDFIAANDQAATPAWRWDHYGVYESRAQTTTGFDGMTRYVLLEKKMLLNN